MASRVFMLFDKIFNKFKSPTSREKKQFQQADPLIILSEIQQKLPALIKEYKTAQETGQPGKITPVLMDLAAQKNRLLQLEQTLQGKVGLDAQKHSITLLLNSVNAALSRNKLLDQFAIQIKYIANQSFQLANVEFASTWNRPPKAIYSSTSLANQPKVKTGDLIARAYGFSTEEGSRDQKTIDIVADYMVPANENQPLYQMVSIFSTINRLNSMLAKMLEKQDQEGAEAFVEIFKGDLNLLENTLKNSHHQQIKNLMPQFLTLKKSLLNSLPKDKTQEVLRP